MKLLTVMDMIKDDFLIKASSLLYLDDETFHKVSEDNSQVQSIMGECDTLNPI